MINMCGIAGFFSPQLNIEESKNLIQKMTDCLARRGPDDSGIWQDPSSFLTFGHRRLSILDLSSQGRQPMISASQRYVITYNGEVYNFLLIRKELEAIGINFKGSSDTEVILAAIDAWGLLRSVKKFVGMFAFAVWDKKEKELCLVRDRFGIKPLYYGWQGKSFIFGSELKTFKTHPDFKNSISKDAFGFYLTYSYVPEAFSIFEGVKKQKPGTILSIKPAEGPEALIQETVFWSTPDEINSAKNDVYVKNSKSAQDDLESVLNQAVQMRLVSDVSLGAFLSGGIDSSLVVALMQKMSSKPVKTFTIGFSEERYNEADKAKKVAEHLGTDHTEEIINWDQARAVIPELAKIYDEPFGDASQIPTLLISRLTRSHVTVALSGDGGDELFGGYHRYERFLSMWKHINSFYGPILKMVGSLAVAGSRSIRANTFFEQKHARDAYHHMISSWEGQLPPRSFPEWNDQLTPLENIMALDTQTYLPSDILVKVDRASMNEGLEVRVPLLDHNFFKFVWRLPMEMKRGKKIMKEILYKYVPQELVNRPKMGFGVPVDSWLKGPLRDWAESHLNSSALANGQFPNSALIQKRWQEHLAGKSNWQDPLWTILMFQEWKLSQ